MRSPTSVKQLEDALISAANELCRAKEEVDKAFIACSAAGLSDPKIGNLLGITREAVRRRRKRLGLHKTRKKAAA
jgi:hypothetical protein